MIVALIPAAGSGSRMGGETPKQFQPLAGIPVLLRTLLVFEHAPSIDGVILAAAAGMREQVQTLITEHAITKVRAVVEGGATRQDSVWNALRACPTEAELVLVHDAVRPFVTAEAIARVTDAARRHGAALLATPVTDTIKQSDEAGFVENTLERDILWRAQTPQAFRRELLENALKRAHHDRYTGTDEASVLEYAGIDVKLVEGEDTNIKITTPFDMRVAEAIVARGDAPRESTTHLQSH